VKGNAVSGLYDIAVVASMLREHMKIGGLGWLGIVCMVAGCGDVSGAEPQSQASTGVLVCSFADEKQLFEVFVRIEQGDKSAGLVIADLRHGTALNYGRMPAQTNQQRLVVTQKTESSALLSVRLHEVNLVDLTYQRRSSIYMGDSPPLISREGGRCRIASEDSFATMLETAALVQTYSGPE
jgi:hypothetical protein